MSTIIDDEEEEVSSELSYFKIIRDIRDEGFVAEDITNPETKKLFADTMEIEISNNNGDIEYTIVESTIEDQE